MHEILPLEGILPPETIIEQEDLHHTVAQLPPPLDDFPPLPRESISSPTRSNASIPPLPPLDGFTDEEAERSVTAPLKTEPLKTEQQPELDFVHRIWRLFIFFTIPRGNAGRLPRVLCRPYAQPAFQPEAPISRCRSRGICGSIVKTAHPKLFWVFVIDVRDSPEQNSGGDSGEGMGLRRSNSAEELQKLFAFDTEDSLSAMQQEHMEAMRWLEERQEQEQRDAEFARILQENWNDPSHPTTASDSSSLLQL